MRKASGFTLIELMITIVVVAILAAIAVPSYIQYIQRGKISEAVSNLSGARLQLEKYFADNRMYGTGGTCGVAMPMDRGSQPDSAVPRHTRIRSTGRAPRQYATPFSR